MTSTDRTRSSTIPKTIALSSPASAARINPSSIGWPQAAPPCREDGDRDGTPRIVGTATRLSCPGPTSAQEDPRFVGDRSSRNPACRRSSSLGSSTDSPRRQWTRSPLRASSALSRRRRSAAAAARSSFPADQPHHGGRVVSLPRSSSCAGPTICCSSSEPSRHLPHRRVGGSAAGGQQGQGASSQDDDLHSPLRSQARRRAASDGGRSARSRSSRAACRLAKARSRMTRVGYFGFQ